MNSDQRPKPEAHGLEPFSLAQRRALIIVLAIFIVSVAVGLLRNRSHLSDPLPSRGARQDELLDRLDPNIADVATLAALPSVGTRRAEAIVAYRELARRRDSTRAPFQTLDDLLRVDGIGTSIIAQMEAYLQFARPTSQPSS